MKTRFLIPLAFVCVMFGLVMASLLGAPRKAHAEAQRQWDRAVAIGEAWEKECAPHGGYSITLNRCYRDEPDDPPSKPYVPHGNYVEPSAPAKRITSCTFTPQGTVCK